MCAMAVLQKFFVVHPPESQKEPQALLVGESAMEVASRTGDQPSGSVANGLPVNMSRDAEQRTQVRSLEFLDARQCKESTVSEVPAAVVCLEQPVWCEIGKHHEPEGMYRPFRFARQSRIKLVILIEPIESCTRWRPGANPPHCSRTSRRTARFAPMKSV